MSSNESPSRVRLLVVLSAMMMAVLLYLDRFCVGFAGDYIREDLNLTQSQMSWFLSAFFWSYALAQVPSGWMSDRYGARIMLVIYILSWSLFTAMIGAVYSFALLMTARLLCGLGQAGAYPTSASIVSKWVPFTERGMASAVISVGGRIGGAIAPLLTAFLIIQFVPMETSPLFTKDNLPDEKTATIAARLAPISDAELSTIPKEFQDKVTKPTEASLFVKDKLPADCQAVALRIGVAYRQKEIESFRAKTELEPLVVSPEDHKILLDGLNQLVQSKGLYDEVAFRAVNPVKEALNFLKKSKTESLTTQEQQRLNRFLLESVFPKEVGKLYTQGWRPVMWIYGAAGIFVALAFWVFVRSRPDVHPWCNQAEQRLIAQGRPPGAPSPHGKPGMLPWKPLLTSRSIWLSCLMQFGTNIGWVFLVTWLPRYLIDVHSVPILERGLMTSVPLFVGIVGMLLGGGLTDWMATKMGVRWGRCLPMSLTRFTAALGYLMVFGLTLLPAENALNTPWMFVIGFSLVAFSTDMGTAAVWAFNQDVGGRYVGSILGFGNMCGNLGAAAAPLIMNKILGETPDLADWNRVFLVSAVAFIIAGICGLGVDASKPIAPPDEDSKVAAK